MANEARQAGRIAHNSAVVGAIQQTATSDDGALELLCECGDLDCGCRLRLSIRDYLALRARNQPAIAPDCECGRDGADTDDSVWDR